MSDRIESTFARVLAPWTARSFIDERWERQTLLLAGSADRFGDLELTRERFLSVARAAPRSTILTAVAGENVVPISGDQAAGLFAAGMTICLSGIDKLHAASRRYAGSAKLLLGHAGHVAVNCYLSPAGQGFPLHFDDHSVFILQLEGSKRWRFSDVPAVEAPPRGLFLAQLPGFRAQHPWLSVRDPTEARLAEQTLRPGDALYLPPGCWHSTSADEYSLALTVAFENFTFRRLVTSVIDGRLVRHAVWRRTLPLEPGEATAPTGLSPRLQQELAARLRELADVFASLEAPDFVQLWRASVADFDWPESSACAPTPNHIARTDRITSDDPIMCVATRGKVHLFCGNQMLEVPAEDRYFLEQLASHRSFVAEDALGWCENHQMLAWPEVREVLEELIATRFLRKLDTQAAEPRAR